MNKDTSSHLGDAMRYLQSAPVNTLDEFDYKTVLRSLTWHNRFANWISGGRLMAEMLGKRTMNKLYAELKEAHQMAQSHNDALTSELKAAVQSQYRWEQFADEEAYKSAAAQEALEEVLAMKTPSCASVGKRMSDAAQKGLDAMASIAASEQAGTAPDAE